MIIDSPIVFQDTERDFTWKPKNYGEKFYGPTLFRNALAKSRNVVTIKILRDIGIDYAIDYAKKLGITSKLSKTWYHVKIEQKSFDSAWFFRRVHA
jgi:penicillin-binding protein 1A